MVAAEMRADVVTGRPLVSGAGTLLGLAFFAASLTPSLIPRDAVLQGLLGGLLFSIGYGIGVALHGLWIWLGLPRWSARSARRLTVAAVLAGIALAGGALTMADDWQDKVRILMGMETLTEAHPFRVLLLASGAAAVLFAVAYLFKLLFRVITARLKTVIPERVAITIGLLLAALLFGAAVNGVLIRWALTVLDASYAELDALIEPDTAPPTDPLKSGSDASLVRWNELGRDGRRFVSRTPTQDDVAGFWGGEGQAPLRVYLGLATAGSAEERAALALEELKRVGGFERSVLVVAIPTGTGFMQQAAIATLEYLHRGDVATVAMQYSYLQSPFSLLFEPGYGADTARELLRAVYGHWTELDRGNRPKLYLQGLSLGALSSERSVQLYEVLGDPINGAVWSGPPFPSPLHASATRERVPGSPAWLPRFGDGQFIRFTNQENALEIPGARWGPMRIVYLQYATDPIVFFDFDLLWREPDWLKEPRGPDVSPDMRWLPLVTAFQVAVDMVVSTNVPKGHGHEYSAQNYIDAWVAVTAPAVTPADIARLERHLGS